jgi:DNA-binding NarL/FixJ family response regulator
MASAGRHEQTRACCPRAPVAEYGERDERLDRLDLTPREREVVALLGEGLTNREIAAELFISDKSASVHVSRILAKLSVPSRWGGAAAGGRPSRWRLNAPPAVTAQD